MEEFEMVALLLFSRTRRLLTSFWSVLSCGNFFSHGRFLISDRSTTRLLSELLLEDEEVPAEKIVLLSGLAVVVTTCSVLLLGVRTLILVSLFLDDAGSTKIDSRGEVLLLWILRRSDGDGEWSRLAPRPSNTTGALISGVVGLLLLWLWPPEVIRMLELLAGATSDEPDSGVCLAYGGVCKRFSSIVRTKAERKYGVLIGSIFFYNWWGLED